ncbi:sulfurtransferase [Pseudanabaena sp. PCC 6802]|uniref:sulfurtransferase n=1 Tax=Pseudanabaena sp. PCC 6802 TaxID=118173 RepID=UPI00034B955F|nr:sulfurtransferase [Pseudanabaena sp. PCC 6802]
MVYSPDRPVVSVQWLHEHLDDPQVAIADCRFALMQPELGRQQYENGHIPGAYYLDLNLDLSGPVSKHGGRHPLPDPDLLATKLSAMGINSSPSDGSEPTLVIAYDDSRFAFASRLWWLLSYLGHERVAVLDGGFKAWIDADYAIATELPEPRSGTFVPRPNPERIVDINYVKARKDLPSVVLIDSREAERYRGEREPIDPIAGHIPGAVNYPWQDASDPQGYLQKDRQARWISLELDKSDKSDEVVVYCGSGVTACVNLLSLHIAGINAKLYPGSWSDWCSYLVGD